jgi:hypothetical protein
MFRESTREVKDHLKEMCRKVEEEMSNKADEVFILMRRDYMTVITGAHMPQGQVMPKAERLARSEIAMIIRRVEERAEKGERYVEDNEEENDSEVGSESQVFDDAREVIKDKPMEDGGSEGDPDEQIKSEAGSPIDVAMTA